MPDDRSESRKRRGSPTSGGVRDDGRHSSSKHRRRYKEEEEEPVERGGSGRSSTRRDSRRGGEGDADWEENGRSRRSYDETRKPASTREQQQKPPPPSIISTSPHIAHHAAPPTLIHPPLPATAPAFPAKAEQQQERSWEAIQEDLKKKEVLYQMNMQIQQRLRQMNMPAQPAQKVSQPMKTATVLKPEEASAFVVYQMQKINRLNELKQRLGRSSVVAPSLVKAPVVAIEAAIGGGASAQAEEHAGAHFPPIAHHAPSSLKAADQQHQQQKGAAQQHTTASTYLDPRLRVKGPSRSHRSSFAFKQQGELAKQGEQLRAKQRLEKLQSEISKIAKQTGISSAVKLAIVGGEAASTAASGEHYVPAVEWWDEIVLGVGSKGYESIPSLDINPQLRYEKAVTSLVEHPIKLKPPDEPLQPQYIKAHLTKHERKKLRRQNRRETMKEHAEKVRLGLEKPPEPKLKISNLMRVLGNDAIQDPTRMESHVKKQIAARMERHVAENAQRKLTKKQRSAKHTEKLAEDTSLGVHVALYRVRSLANPAIRFKVQTNAKQLQMTGLFLQLQHQQQQKGGGRGVVGHADDDFCVVAVEGGPKQQKFYRNLMLKRIKWGEELVADYKQKLKEDESIEEGGSTAAGGERNECVLVWEGVVQKRAFGEPRFLSVPNHKSAREALEKHGVSHYWDLCYSTTVLLSSED